jgi:integrase/recombinase XerD
MSAIEPERLEPVNLSALWVAGEPDTDRNLSGAPDDAELVALWLKRRRSERTRKTYTRELAWWRAELGRPLAFVTLTDLQAALDRARELAPRSIALRVAVLRSLFSFAHRTGYLRFNVGAALEGPKAPDRRAERMLEPDEFAALLAATRGSRHGSRDHAIVRALYVIGCRCSELVALPWDRFHRNEDGSGSVTIDGKGGETRHVWISAGTVLELEGLEPELERRTGRIFRNRFGSPLEVRDVQKLVTRAAKRAGIPRAVSPHWLRHTTATRRALAGAPLHEIAADLGHASIRTTSLYLHARPGRGSAAWLDL